MDTDTRNAILKLTEAAKKSKCNACGSEAYGKGCIYGARGIHLHLDDPTRCSWCGSKTIYGKGCIYSPTGYHGIGANLYTNMPTEAFITSYLIKKLKTSFVDTKAFEMGLISENGTLVRKPQTPEEKAAYTVLDSFVFKIKKFLGAKLDLINETTYFELSKKAINENSSVEEYEKELHLKRKLDNISKQFKDVISEARDNNISEAVIEKTIVDTFTK